MLQIQTYHDSGPAGRLAADCRRYRGCTVYWVIPFTPTGSTPNVAGGRLPPLHQNYYKYRMFYVPNVGFAFRIMEKTLYVDVVVC